MPCAVWLRIQNVWLAFVFDFGKMENAFVSRLLVSLPTPHLLQRVTLASLRSHHGHLTLRVLEVLAQLRHLLALALVRLHADGAK